MTKITSAELLENVFTKFSSFLPETNGTHITILNIWVKTFDSGFASPKNEIFKKIIEVSEMLDTLKFEIDQSTKMKDNQKNFAKSTVMIFDPVAQITNLNRRAQDYISSIDDTMCGRLGLISHSIASEFSESKLSEGDIVEIIKELEVVYEQLDNESLPIKLRRRLRHQILAVIWRLKNPTFECIQDVYEDIGNITLTALEANRMYNPSADKGKQYDFCIKIMSALDKVRKCIETGQNLYDSAQSITQAIKPFIGQ